MNAYAVGSNFCLSCHRLHSMTCRKKCCRFELTDVQIEVDEQNGKKMKSKTKGRKNTWRSKRNCLTFVTVCNCHLIAIEILCFVVSYKLCVCADINVSLYQSIYRIFIHIVDFSFSVFPSLHGTICPIHFHYQTNRIESIRSERKHNQLNWCLAEIFTPMLLQSQSENVFICFFFLYRKNKLPKTLMWYVFVRSIVLWIIV